MATGFRSWFMFVPPFLAGMCVGLMIRHAISHFDGSPILCMPDFMGRGWLLLISLRSSRHQVPFSFYLTRLLRCYESASLHGCLIGMLRGGVERLRGRNRLPTGMRP